MSRNRIARMAENRQMYVRTGPYNLLVNDYDGFVTDRVNPQAWGDFPVAGNPGWYLGSDTMSSAIGPNGPHIVGSAAQLMPAVTRCTNVIASTIVRTLWKYTGPDGTVLPRPTWIDDPMGLGTLPGTVSGLLPAGMRLDGHRLFETFLTHALWWGRGAFVYVENAEGQPTPGSLRLINPWLVWPDENGHWVIDPRGETPIRTDFNGRFLAGGKVWRLVVMRGMAPNDGTAPEGVLVRHFETFRLGASVSKYVARTFEGLGVPSGLLKVGTPGFKDTDAKKLKEDWMAAHGSSKRSVAVLNATVEFQPISITPVDANAEGMVHVTRLDIAHAFGLAGVWLDEGASGLTYQNNSDRRRDLVDISLAGWSESLMATLTAILPFGTRVEVDWATFTQPSIEALASPLVQMVQTGILTADEARQYLGLIRKTGPDPSWRDNSPATQPAQLQITAGGSDDQASA